MSPEPGEQRQSCSCCVGLLKECARTPIDMQGFLFLKTEKKKKAQRVSVHTKQHFRAETRACEEAGSVLFPVENAAAWVRWNPDGRGGTEEQSGRAARDRRQRGSTHPRQGRPPPPRRSSLRRRPRGSQQPGRNAPQGAGPKGGPAAAPGPGVFRGGGEEPQKCRARPCTLMAPPRRDTRQPGRDRPLTPVFTGAALRPSPPASRERALERRGGAWTAAAAATLPSSRAVESSGERLPPGCTVASPHGRSLSLGLPPADHRLPAAPHAADLRERARSSTEARAPNCPLADCVRARDSGDPPRVAQCAGLPDPPGHTRAGGPVSTGRPGESW